MPTFAQVKATATRAGYTRRVIVEMDDSDYYGWVKPSADFASTFTMIDDETAKVFNFKGYDVNVRDLDQ